MKKPESLQTPRANSHLEQPKLKPSSSLTNLVEARNNTVDSADLKGSSQGKKENKSKTMAANSNSITNFMSKKPSEEERKPLQKTVTKKEVNLKDVTVRAENKSAVIKQEIRTSSSNKEATFSKQDIRTSPSHKDTSITKQGIQTSPLNRDSAFSKSLPSSSYKYDTVVSNVKITNPFDHAMSSIAHNDSLNQSKANRQFGTSVTKFDAPATKSTAHCYEKPVQNILDYATAPAEQVGMKPFTFSSSGASKVSATETSRTKILQKSSPMPKATSSLQQTQFSSHVVSKWTPHAHPGDHTASFLSKSPPYSMPAKHVFHEAASKPLISSKHASSTSSASSKIPKPIYKTPPKEHHKSLSATPPKSSPQNVSPHGAVSAGVSRTSPLLHFQPSIEQQRRLSGHSPDELRNSHVGLSHSISRLDSTNICSQVKGLPLP